MPLDVLMDYAESPVWHATPVDNRVCPKPFATGRVGLGCARLQHIMSTPEDTERGLALSRFQRTTAPPYRQHRHQGRSGMRASIPLTHASMCCRAVGGSKRRIWRKIHIGVDEETLEVRAVEVTSSNIGDAPMLPPNPTRSRHRQCHRRRGV